ncbi:MAG: NigD-like protein [Bacteroidales bacterium]|nr:NigD-like protein [Bacteroidales bacterium]MCM1148450.1 NigD-like protein [Bacteroidales bacterium]MCM1207270.1 NigD-like protein [Bacillota bacterium]MCM1511489.1 NigD-like protein [Clostridium sp.]
MKTMKYSKTFLIALLAAVLGLQSCDSNYDYAFVNFPNGLVTVKVNPEGKTYFQLDEATTLFPENLSSTLYDGKEVRALMNFEVLEKATEGYTKTVRVNWIDSIRTKDMIALTGELAVYVRDPIEIVNDWVTVAEDGYLTLRVRTLWGGGNRPHYLNLIGGVNDDNPFEVELRHDAKGDVNGAWGDALIAFRLSELPAEIPENQKLTLRWLSFDGTVKKADFTLKGKPSVSGDNVGASVISRGGAIR